MNRSDSFLEGIEQNSSKIGDLTERETYLNMHCDFWARYIHRRGIPLGKHPLTDLVRVMQLLSEPREFDESIVMYYKKYAFAQNLYGECLFGRSNTRCNITTCVSLDSNKIWKYCTAKFLEEACDEGLGSLFMYENLIENRLFQIADKAFLTACLPYKSGLFCEMSGNNPLDAIRMLVPDDLQEKIRYSLIRPSLLLKIFTMPSIKIDKLQPIGNLPIVEFGLDTGDEKRRLWRPEIHEYFDFKFRSIVHTFFLVRNTKFRCVPRVLVHYIIKIMQQVWY